MTDPGGIPDLHGRATVALPVESAFRFFTESMGRWWPAEYRIGESEMVDTVLEPYVGGRWFERGADGSECTWGHVLAWEPPHRLVVSWQITGSWRYDDDPDRASEIEVRFTPDGPDQTVVELQHRHLERLVGGEAVRKAIEEGGGGWSTLLRTFADAATA
ncbi:SRPBCC family protein [uncultured Cellulomonas sp.]|uniref:SRPBCC family protein n=1 Tax=uncultured Cellulomonas sp. TaxID=189682 RepID=UPI0028E639F3|nr:SRPBCC family protein [uncultured Cellulomonas sp.]